MLGSHRYALGLATLIAVTSATVLLAAQQQPSRATDDEVKQLLTRIEKNAVLFQDSLVLSPDREWLVAAQMPGNIDHFVTSFVVSIQQLRQRFGRGQVVASRVDDVLRRGASIDSFMEHHRSTDQAQQHWTTVRRDLEALAVAYNVIWNRRTSEPYVATARHPAR
jgi:hypothetical protein